MQILEAQNINVYNTQKVNISKHGEHRGLRLANIYKLYRKPTIQVLAYASVRSTECEYLQYNTQKEEYLQYKTWCRDSG